MLLISKSDDNFMNFNKFSLELNYAKKRLLWKKISLKRGRVTSNDSSFFKESDTIFYIWKYLYQVRNMTVVVYSFHVFYHLILKIWLETFRFDFSSELSIFCDFTFFIHWWTSVPPQRDFSLNQRQSNEDPRFLDKRMTSTAW